MSGVGRSAYGEILKELYKRKFFKIKTYSQAFKRGWKCQITTSLKKDLKWFNDLGQILLSEFIRNCYPQVNWQHFDAEKIPSKMRFQRYQGKIFQWVSQKIVKLGFKLDCNYSSGDLFNNFHGNWGTCKFINMKQLKYQRECRSGVMA